MLFTSLEFLLLFLPIVLIGYYLMPRDEDAWNMWLLPASLIFYATGEPRFVFFLIFSIVFNYGIALLLTRTDAARRRKRLLRLSVAVNIGVLFVFKYLNFAVSILHGMLPFTEKWIPQTHIALPIGISFFTFQAMSYVIDVYRGVPVQKSPANFGLYVSFFPQLIAGPIVRYTTVMEEIRHRSVDWNGFSNGMIRFMRGFNKKVLLSNALSEVTELCFGAQSLGTGMAWTGALAYSLQLFYYFSGYSDMAIGLGEIFGFHFMENFDYPYIARTVTEFWRRWYISLGSWFRDYVYFPMGGSRVKSRWKLIRNLAVVWLLTGIWYGANWTFLFWGALHGAFIILEKLLNLPKRLSKSPLPLRALYYLFTMLVVVLGWVLFNSADIASGFAYIRTMFSAVPDAEGVRSPLYYWYEYRAVWLFGFLAATPIFAVLRKKLISLGDRWETAVRCGGGLVQLMLFWWSVSSIVMNAHNPFIYFNF